MALTDPSESSGAIGAQTPASGTVTVQGAADPGVSTTAGGTPKTDPIGTTSGTVQVTNAATVNASVLQGRAVTMRFGSFDLQVDNTIPTNDPNLLVDDTERITNKFSEYHGRGTLLIYETEPDLKPIGQKVDMIITGMQYQRQEAQSMMKNLIGFNFFALDTYPATIALSGFLINSAGDQAALNVSGADRAKTQNWFIQFLKDYDSIGASAAIRAGYRIMFSIEDFTAEVHILNQSTSSSSESPYTVGFNMMLLVRRQNYRGANDFKTNLTKTPKFVGSVKASDAKAAAALHQQQDQFAHGNAITPATTQMPIAAELAQAAASVAGAAAAGAAGTGTGVGAAAAGIQYFVTSIFDPNLAMQRLAGQFLSVDQKDRQTVRR
jgi:hypothetical protein